VGEAAVDPIEERVARQEAAEATRGLFAAYADANDAKHLGQLEAIFAPDVVVSTPATWSGLAQVLGFYRQAWASSPLPSRHFVSNVAMRRLEPDFVEATAYFLYVTAGADERPMIGWGTYRTTVVSHDGRYVIATLDIAMDLLVDARDGWGAAMSALASR